MPCFSICWSIKAITQEYTKKLEDELEALKNAGSHLLSGDTLPSVLEVGNTKALVTTLGSFTTVFNEKFDTLNGVLTACLFILMIWWT